MPQEFKAQKKSEAARIKAVLSRDTTNITSQDTPLPRGVSEPGPLSQEGAFKEPPSFKQIQDSHSGELVECDSCHCYAHQTQRTNNIFLVDFGGSAFEPIIQWTYALTRAHT